MSTGSNLQDAFVVDYVRSPFGRVGGSLAAVRPDDLAAHVIASLLERHPGLDPAALDEVVMGCANQAGEDNRNVARMAVLLAGLPEGVPGTTVNRLCGSGLDAVAIAARQVRTGEADLVIAGGAASQHGLTPVARVTGAATAGVAPRVMGIGPAPATRKLLDRLGLTVDDVDVVELNEAFASQALAVLRERGIPDDAGFVNPNGGAIALGHPLGASGARLCGTAALELRRRGGKRAIATMCIGVGQGISLALEAA